MDYREKLAEATETLEGVSRRIYDWEVEAVKEIKRILTPCGEGGCLIGSEDYDDGIYYVYAEPKPNRNFRVTAIRYFPEDDTLQVQLDFAEDSELTQIYDTDEDGWMAFGRAHISNMRFLLDEICLNLEYSDGYQEGDSD